MTYVDLVAFADATYTVATKPEMLNGVASPEPHLTPSGWASMAGLIPIGISLYGLSIAVSRKWRGEGSWSDVASQGATFAITGTQMGAQATAGIASMSGASSVAAAAGSVAVGANAVAGVYQAAMASREIYRMEMVGNRYKEAKKNREFARICEEAKRGKDKSNIDYLLTKIVSKCYRREYRADVDIISGLASTSGAGIGFALIGGATAAAVPDAA